VKVQRTPAPNYLAHIMALIDECHWVSQTPRS
jgi:hypothetical protein